jgi:hypothetical protein
MVTSFKEVLVGGGALLAGLMCGVIVVMRDLANVRTVRTSQQAGLASGPW